MTNSAPNINLNPSLNIDDNKLSSSCRKKKRCITKTCEGDCN